MLANLLIYIKIVNVMFKNILYIFPLHQASTLNTILIDHDQIHKTSQLYLLLAQR